LRSSVACSPFLAAIGLFEISFGEVPESVRGFPIQCATCLDQAPIGQIKTFFRRVVFRSVVTHGRALLRTEGLPLTAQIAGRPIGVMMGIGTALNPFTLRPSYKALESLPIEEQRKRLRDPELRRFRRRSCRTRSIRPPPKGCNETGV
jgi:hypothetical protein